MAYDNVLVDIDGPVAVVTVNRPKALNALNPKTMQELQHAFEHVGDGVRVIIVTGAGEKAFVAGADITAMANFTPAEATAFAAAGHELGFAMARVPQILIAAVNGFALGGGTELALACDFAYASENAKFGQPEVNLGVIPGFGGTQRLPRLVGTAMAMELCATGEIIPAAEALRIGLVNKVVPAAELLPAAKATATKIASKGPVAVTAVKRSIRASLEMPLAQGIQHEIESFGALFVTQDQKEGMAAFIQKRAPSFQGK